MFDIGFLELVLIAVIALLVLGPERLPGAARSAGLWIGKLRRMTSQFTKEIDRQLKAEEFREKLRKEGDTLGVEHIQGTVKQALDRAKDFEDSIIRDTTVNTAAERDAQRADPPAPEPAAPGPAAPGNTVPAEPPSTTPSTSNDTSNTGTRSEPASGEYTKKP